MAARMLLRAPALRRRAPAALQVTTLHHRCCGRLPQQRRGLSQLAALEWETARFGGANIAVDAVAEDFEERLVLTLAELETAGRRGVWMHVPIEHAGAAAAAARHGFSYHSAEGGASVLLRWLPDGPCPVPAFATHIVGVGGLVINSKQEVLCVREARTPSDQPTRTSWKLPGGLMDLGEEIGEAAAREVYEETGVRAEFQSLISMRVQHGAAFGRDDFYFVCAMEPLTEDIDLTVADTDEIAECAWLPLEEYVASTDELAQERGVGDTMNSWLMRNVAHEMLDPNGRGHPADWGWTQTALPAGGARSANHITGWGNREYYNMLTPHGFMPPRGAAPSEAEAAEAAKDEARRRRIANLIAKTGDEPTAEELSAFDASNKKLRGEVEFSAFDASRAER
jgi:ADP-ribose pyrophosphatase YjhB (NUDIX family)